MYVVSSHYIYVICYTVIVNKFTHIPRRQEDKIHVCRTVIDCGFSTFIALLLTSLSYPLQSTDVRIQSEILCVDFKALCEY